MKLYTRLVQGVIGKGDLYPSESVHDHIIDTNVDWYTSVYYYTEEHYNQFYEKTSFGGIRGCGGITDVFTDKIVFDFDTNEVVKTLDDVRTDVKIAITALKQRYNLDSTNYDIFFSGNKGFSIEFKIDEYWTPEKAKAFAKTIYNGLPSADSKVYNANRLFRVPTTRNVKTGLYKTALSTKDFHTLSIETIKELASDPSNCIPYGEKKEVHLKFQFEQSDTKPTLKAGALDISKRPKWLSLCKYLILMGRFKGGNRSHSLMALCATLKSQGLPEETARSILNGACDTQAQLTETERFPQDELEDNILSQVYSDKWNGATYACKDHEFLQELCSEYPGNECNRIDKKTEIVTIGDMFDRFQTFAANIDTNRIYTGLPELDKRITLTSSMPVGILASPSAGKTSLAMNILKNTSKNGIKSIFASLDMSIFHVTAKLISSYYNMSFEEVIDLAKTRPLEYREAIQEIKEVYQNVSHTFKSGTMVDDLRRMIISEEDKSGDKVKLVLIDYFELISSSQSDDFVGAKQVMNGLKDLTTDLDVCTIILLQPQKSAGDPSFPITSMRQIKGSSILEQTLRVIFGLYREGFDPSNPENDNFMTINCLKNTMGSLFSLDFAWGGQKGSIESLDAKGRAQLADLREYKKSQKDSENKSNWN